MGDTGKNANKLILGRGEGLEEYLRESIEACKQENPLQPLRVVVDTNLTGVYLRRLLARRGTSHLNVRFSTFTDLAREMSEKNLQTDAAVLPYYGGERLLQKIVSSIDASSYFAPVSRHTGFTEALKATFQELREAGLEEIESRARGVDSGKKELLNLLYREYLNHLGDFRDEAAMYRAARDAPAEGLPDWPVLYFYGIYRLTRRQEELLLKLAGHLSVHVFMHKAAAHNSRGNRLIEWFREAGFELDNLPPPSGSGDGKGSRRGILQEGLLKKNIAAGNNQEGESGEEDNSLEIWSTPGEVEEAHEIGRRMLELARLGYRFRDMAVLIKDSGYIPLLQETFASRGIPCYSPSGRNLDATAPGRSLLLCLQLWGSAWNRKQVMEVLTSAPFAFSRITGSSREVSTALWDYFSVEAGITRGIDSWEKQLSHLEDKYRRMLEAQQSKHGRNTSGADDEDTVGTGDPEWQLQQLKLFRYFLAELQKNLEAFPGRDSWPAFVERLEFFVKLFFRETREQEEVLKSLGLLRSLGRLEEDVSLEEFRDLVSRVIKETTCPRGNFQKDGVNLLPLKSALNLRFPVVFLPGMLEKVYPSPFRQDPLLLEEERKGIPGLPLRRETLQEDRLHFSLALQSSTDRLYLSYPRQDSRSGRELVPSHYLLEAGELLCGGRLTLDGVQEIPGYRHINTLQDIPVEKALTRDEFNLIISQKVSGEVLNSYFRGEIPWWNRVRHKAACHSRRELTRYEGMLEEPGVKENILSFYSPYKRTLSVTYLENYLACPYRFFLERMLRAVPWEEPEERLRLEGLDRGSLIHEALEMFYRQAQKEGLLPLTPPGLPRARELMWEILEPRFRKAEEANLTGYRLVWEIDRENIASEMMEFLEHEAQKDTGRVPWQFEIVFGESGTFRHSHVESTRGNRLEQPVVVEPASFGPYSGQKLFFRGRIDRVDAGPGENLRVLDYKTGKVNLTSKKLKENISLQLSLYLLAARELFGSRSLEQVEAAFLYLSRREGYPELILEGKEWAEKEEQFKEKLADTCRLLEEGCYFPYPGDACRWCSYTAVCGPEIQQLMYLKEGDKRMQDLAHLKEGLVSG